VWSTRCTSALAFPSKTAPARGGTSGSVQRAIAPKARIEEIAKRARADEILIATHAWDPAARIRSFEDRYCVDRHEHWTRVYAKGNAGAYPRYLVLSAILLEIERIDPTTTTVERLRELLALAGQTAHTMFTRPPKAVIGVCCPTPRRNGCVTT